MIGHRSIAIGPEIRNSYNNVKTKIETNHRIWLKLILSALIPLMIAVFTIVTTVIQQRLSYQQREQDKYDTKLLREQSSRLADILQKETVLVSYLNDVSQLLMTENNSQTIVHIRTKTLTSLRQLDPERKRYLFLFLYESELIYLNSSQQLLRLHGADLNGIQFNGTYDNRCSFAYLYLYNVYLSNGSFIDCFIDRSNFSYGIMHNTRFYKGLLIRNSFKMALLDNSCFCNMKLSTINFNGASLIGSDFQGTIWDNSSVDFTNANLTGAKLSNEQLKNSTLYNCILPNKTWGPIITRNLVVNGDIQQNCLSDNGTILLGWNNSYLHGEIRAYPNNLNNLTKCYLRSSLFNSSRHVAFIIQTISLENYNLLISAGNARYNASATFQCFGKQKATMVVRFIDANGLRDGGVDNETIHGKTDVQSLVFSNILRTDTRHVQLTITIFRSYILNETDTTIEGNFCACYNIKFMITKNN